MDRCCGSLKCTQNLVIFYKRLLWCFRKSMSCWSIWLVGIFLNTWLSILGYFSKAKIFFNRLLVREARRLAASYHLKYEEHIPTSQLVQQVASVMQEYTQQGFVHLVLFKFRKLCNSISYNRSKCNDSSIHAYRNHVATYLKDIDWLEAVQMYLVYFWTRYTCDYYYFDDYWKFFASKRGIITVENIHSSWNFQWFWWYGPNSRFGTVSTPKL